MLRRFALAVMVTLAGLSVTAAEAQKDRKPPYWASISATKALMRTGPGKNFPAMWMYVREDLPIRVVRIYPDWRRIQDPSGTTGWMQQGLLSDTRTAIVTGGEPRPMRVSPSARSPVRYRAQPGVVGRLLSCARDWCQLDVGGRQGYIQAADIWGVDPGESFS